MGMFDSKNICDEFKGWRKRQCKAREDYAKKNGKSSGKDDIKDALGNIGKAAKGKGFSEFFKALIGSKKKSKK